MNITISKQNITIEQIITLYKANNWSAASKPEQLYNGLLNSHNLVTAWDSDQLVGLGNAISDGFLMVYFPHLLVLPAYQHKGVGKSIMLKMQELYTSFHMQMLTADEDSITFYEKMGFTRAGNTQPMWIYQGNEH